MEQEITAHIDDFISVTVISITVKIKNLDTRKGDDLSKVKKDWALSENRFIELT